MENKNNNRKRPGMGSGLLFYGVLLVLLIVLSSVLFGNDIDGTTVKLEYLDENGDPGYLNQSIPYDYVDDLVAKLEDAKADGKIESYNYTEPFDWGTLINLLTTVGMIVIVVVIFMSINRQAKDGGGVFAFGSNKADEGGIQGCGRFR